MNIRISDTFTDNHLGDELLPIAFALKQSLVPNLSGNRHVA